MDDTQLYGILKRDAPEDIFEEVLVILNMISSNFNTISLSAAFVSTLSLYEGCLLGYRRCNTRYHDIDHTVDTFLAAARLIHGLTLEGRSLTDNEIRLGLIAALFHDAGYIQEVHDLEGTGAKYTTIHVQRSMDFLELHGEKYGFSTKEIEAGRLMILCTDLAVDIHDIEFPTENYQILGKILAVSDLLSQMSDRIYLEKLLYLYEEFREGMAGVYKNEVDLLRKTLTFFDFCNCRLDTLLDQHDDWLKRHFDARWDIRKNLYGIAMKKHRRYLDQIAPLPDVELLGQLKRAGIVDEMHSCFSENDKGNGVEPI